MQLEVVYWVANNRMVPEHEGAVNNHKAPLYSVHDIHNFLELHVVLAHCMCHVMVMSTHMSWMYCVDLLLKYVFFCLFFFIFIIYLCLFCMTKYFCIVWTYHVHRVHVNQKELVNVNLRVKMHYQIHLLVVRVCIILLPLRKVMSQFLAPANNN